MAYFRVITDILTESEQSKGGTLTMFVQPALAIKPLEEARCMENAKPAIGINWHATQERIAELRMRYQYYSSNLQHPWRWRSALLDALMLIACTPEQATGYLRVGHVLCENCDFKKALQIYECGLLLVSQEDPGFTQLITARSKARSRMNRRIDFVATLPSDLVGVIFAASDQLDCVRCTAVSRLWRHFLLTWPGMWRHISLNYSPYHIRNGYTKQREWYHQYVKGEYVRQFSFINFGRIENGGPQQLLEQWHCHRVESLRLTKSEISTKWFVAWTQVHGGNLNELILSHSGIPVNLMLGHLLEHCPNLKSLVFFWKPEDVTTLMPSMWRTHKTLNRLTLEQDIQDVGIVLPVERMLQCFPNLKWLRLYMTPYHQNRALKHIAEHHILPHLKILEVGHDGSFDRSFIEKGKGEGLCVLSVNMVNYPPSDLIANLLASHSRTLQVLSFVHASAVPLSIWSTMAVSKFDRLQYLTCINSRVPPFSASREMSSFLQNSPKLREISLSNLSLEMRNIAPAFNDLGSVKILKISYCPMLDGAWMLPSFVKSLTHLREVGFLGLEYLGDETLTALSEIESLEGVTIIACAQVTDAGVSQLVNRMPMLKRLRVQRCLRAGSIVWPQK